MVVSSTLVEPNAASTRAMVEFSFARPMAVIATFSEERTPSCPLGRWDSPLIVETQGGCKGAGSSSVGQTGTVPDITSTTGMGENLSPKVFFEIF